MFAIAYLYVIITTITHTFPFVNQQRARSPLKHHGHKLTAGTYQLTQHHIHQCRCITLMIMNRITQKGKRSLEFYGGSYPEDMGEARNALLPHITIHMALGVAGGVPEHFCCCTVAWRYQRRTCFACTGLEEEFCNYQQRVLSMRLPS